MSKNATKAIAAKLRRQEVRTRTQTPVGDRSRTKQSFAEECNINLIVKRHHSEGVVTHFNKNAPRFGDFTTGGDLKTSMDQVFQAKEDFATLPSAVRAAAENRPEVLLNMLDNPTGQEALQRAGLDLGIELPEDQEQAPVPNNSPEPQVADPAQKTATD